MLVYGLQLPAPTAADVASYQVTEVVNGGEPRTFEAHDGDEVKYERHASVTLTVREVDGDGNASDPSEPFTFTATDTIPPPQPGQPGVSLIREE